MVKRRSIFVESPPARRPLKIFAFDPMLGRAADNRIAIDIANEPLAAGPHGSRVQVVDYDGANKCYYEPEIILLSSSREARHRQNRIPAFTSRWSMRWL